MAKAIKFMTQEEKFEKCLNEAWRLHIDEFTPELDSLEDKTIKFYLNEI